MTFWVRLLALALSVATMGCDITPEVLDEDATVATEEEEKEKPADARCGIRLDMLKQPPRFEDFPAVPIAVPRRVPPILDTPDKRMFRTMIRLGAKEGPIFAGRYTLASWGCGTECRQFAIVDPATGRVFYREPQGIGGRPYDDELIAFRADSRLIVLVGERVAPDDERDGVYFLEWTGQWLREIQYVPREQTCRPLAPE